MFYVSNSSTKLENLYLKLENKIKLFWNLELVKFHISLTFLVSIIFLALLVNSVKVDGDWRLEMPWYQ